MDYSYNSSYNQSGEPDYYEVYTKAQTKIAKGVFSRFHAALLAYILSAYAISILAELVLLFTLGADGMTAFINNHVYVGWLLSFLPMYLFGLPVFYLIIKDMKTVQLEKTKMGAAEFFSMFLICQLCITVGSIIGNTLNNFFGVLKGSSVTDHTSELISSMPIWLTILVVVIIGPVIEELIFRKLMIDRLSRYGNTVAILVSAISFGLFHGNLYQFFYAALVGIVFGFMYAKTRNVIYPILMHVLVNFLGSVIPSLLTDRLNELITMMSSLYEGIEVDMSRFFKNLMIAGSYSAIQYAMIIGGAVMLYKFIRSKKYKIRDYCEYRLPLDRAANIIIVNAGSIAFLVISVILFAYSVIM
ncbi:MAG: CPBP family intramembrane metalloprotease [Ruminococcaceae bacterium]|nr:CPBP family intramembrane metalloprotease [Oscillospiraceae bacterium]